MGCLKLAVSICSYNIPDAPSWVSQEEQLKVGASALHRARNTPEAFSHLKRNSSFISRV